MTEQHHGYMWKYLWPERQIIKVQWGKCPDPLEFVENSLEKKREKWIEVDNINFEYDFCHAYIGLIYISLLLYLIIFREHDKQINERRKKPCGTWSQWLKSEI